MYIFREESFCSFLIRQFIGVTVLHASPEWFYLRRHFHSHKEYYRCKRPMQLSDATASFPFCLSQRLTLASKLHVTAAVGEISSCYTRVYNRYSHMYSLPLTFIM